MPVASIFRIVKHIEFLQIEGVLADIDIVIADKLGAADDGTVTAQRLDHLACGIQLVLPGDQVLLIGRRIGRIAVRTQQGPLQAVHHRIAGIGGSNIVVIIDIGVGVWIVGSGHRSRIVSDLLASPGCQMIGADSGCFGGIDESVGIGYGAAIIVELGPATHEAGAQDRIDT